MRVYIQLINYSRYIERKSQQLTLYIDAILNIQFPSLVLTFAQCFHLLQLQVFHWVKQWCGCCGSGTFWASHFPGDPQAEVLRLQSPRRAARIGAETLA